MEHLPKSQGQVALRLPARLQKITGIFNGELTEFPYIWEHLKEQKFMASILASELITNPDGSVFHLHLQPEELADRVILVGDPGRVDMFASHFEDIECRKQNREFCSATGHYAGQRFTVLSTGIGPDNIDIVMNELDALANIDWQTKEVKPARRQLHIVRVGTSGSVQADVPVGSFVISERHIGCDGVLRFYGRHEAVCDAAFEDAFIAHCGWTPQAARPYAVAADPALVALLDDGLHTVRGTTLTAVGFYAPQGRVLRLPLAMPGINERIASFRYEGHRVVNYEMEGAAITGLCNLMGHRATTICLIIANRATGDTLADYHEAMEQLVVHVLASLTQPLKNSDK